MQETVAKPSRSFVQTERQFTGQGHPKPHGGSPGSGNSSHGLASPSILGSARVLTQLGETWAGFGVLFYLFIFFDHPGKGKNRSSY